MLIIAKQRPLGIGGKGGLAGARQAEEHGRVAALIAFVGGTMHRHDAFAREQEVEIAKDRLFGFARIRRVADQHELAREITGNDGFGIRAVARGISLETRQVHNRELRRETL